MKITHKIILLVALGLMVLALNTGVALFHFNRVEKELSSVASRDLGLMEVVNALYQQQLEQKILFEKLKAVGEELGSAQVNDSRKNYLQDYVKGLRDACVRISDRTQLAIAKGRVLLGPEAMRLDSIEKGYKDYQGMIVKMTDEIATGLFQLSFEHLTNFARKESMFTDQLRALLKDIEVWVTRSVGRAQQLKQKTQGLLLGIFAVSVFICGIWAWFIMASIRRPLTELTKAAAQIGRGDFRVQLKTGSHDEIAQVATAFNVMSGQLQDFKDHLEEQNKLLAAQLDLTEQQRKDLEKVNHELDRFVHTASHDIVGPLTAIVGYGAFLEGHYAHLLDDKGKDCLAGVRKGAGRLNKLIKDLLELTRVSRIKNPYTETLVKDMVDAALANCDFKIQETNSRVIIDDYLPRIVCDRIKTTIIFTNLIGNAVKYSAKKNPQGGEIHIGHSRAKGFYEFYVKDNGIGIPPEHHAGIFDMFERLHSNEEYEGSGAGLAIVKAAVEDQGGAVRVESVLGQGAIFFFTIPANLLPYRPII